MASAAQRECRNPSCRLLTTDSYCDKHQKNTNKQQYDRARNANDPERKRRNSPRWRLLRQEIRARDRYCKIAAWLKARNPDAATCDGLSPTQVVDHIIPVRAGGAEWDPDNLQGGCKADHDYKTAMYDRPRSEQ